MPRSTPAFSVVVPAFNRAATVARTVASVLTQEVDGDLELVVVDDGSTDETATVVHDAIAGDARATLLRAPHAGVGAARNAGARAAHGEVVVFLDADDEAASGWLGAFAARCHPCDPDSDVDLVFGAALWRWPDGRTQTTRPEPLGPAFADLVGQWSPGTFAVRRSLLLGVGGYATALAYSENTELGMRLAGVLAASGRRSAHHDEALVTFHMPDGAWTNAWSDRTRFESALYLLGTHAEALALDPRQLASYHAIAGVAATRLGRHRDARRCFARAARAHPLDPRHLGRLALSVLPAARRRRWPPRDERGPRVDP